VAKPHAVCFCHDCSKAYNVGTDGDEAASILVATQHESDDSSSMVGLVDCREERGRIPAAGPIGLVWMCMI
jgi:hypothetical protein